MAASRDLLTEKEEDTGREVVPSEGEGDSPVCQSFEETLFGLSWVLKDSGELFSVAEEWRCHLTILVMVMHSYLFICFHLMFLPITF